LAQIVFLSRFWLDQKIADLYAQTAQRIAIIEATQSFEEEFRFLQNRLEKIKALDGQKPDQTEKIEKVVAILPEKINLTSLEINQDQVNFSIVSRSEKDLNTFFQNLILCPYLDQINIASISNKTFGLETELSIKAKIIND